ASVRLGAAIDVSATGEAERGRRRVGDSRRYVVYCGRYSEQKELPLLLDFARRYHALWPERFRFVFVGQGHLQLPQEPWARDLGFVDEPTKRDVLAGAAALAQLSRRESLSLVALEAWAQGVPVIAHRECTALAEHLSRADGGRAVADFAEF